jgi:hypothetical protein
MHSHRYRRTVRRRDRRDIAVYPRASAGRRRASGEQSFGSNARTDAARKRGSVRTHAPVARGRPCASTRNSADTSQVLSGDLVRHLVNLIPRWGGLPRNRPEGMVQSVCRVLGGLSRLWGAVVTGDPRRGVRAQQHFIGACAPSNGLHISEFGARSSAVGTRSTKHGAASFGVASRNINLEASGSDVAAPSSNFVAATGNFSVPSSDVASASDNFGAPHSDISPPDIDFLGLRDPGLLSEHPFCLGELRHCFPEQQSCCPETSTLSFRATISKLRASSSKLGTPRLPLAEGKYSLRGEPPVRLHPLGTALRRGCCGGAAGAAAEALAQVVGDGLHPLYAAPFTA